MEEKEILAQKLEAKTLKALGLFLIFFSSIVLLSTFFTTLGDGIIINLSAGGLLLMIGIGMLLKGKTMLIRIEQYEN